MSKRFNVVVTFAIGVLCAFMMLFVGINAVNNKKNMPFELSVDMKQAMQVQVDISRTNEYGQKTDAVTVFNNTPSKDNLGNSVDKNAVVDSSNGTVALNPWHNVFEGLSNSDTLSFTVHSYTRAPLEYGEVPACIKFTIDGIVDENNNAMRYSLSPTNSISYIKMYDGTNAFSGTLNITNLVALQDFTKVFVKCTLEVVPYENVILSSDTYNIKEYTEAEYSVNSLGSTFSCYTTAEYNTDLDRAKAGTSAPGEYIASLNRNNYTNVKGYMGYYYYLEMGEYPQDYAGNDITNAFNAFYGTANSEIKNFNVAGIKNITVGDRTYRLTPYKMYYQRLRLGSGVGTVLCPIYWFKDVDTGEIFARSQVYPYGKHNDGDYQTSKYWSTVTNMNLIWNGSDAYDGATSDYPNNGVNIPTDNSYNWFKVQPMEWLIYDGLRGKSNAEQLMLINSYLKVNRGFAVYAKYTYDNSDFYPSGWATSDYNNNWATSFLRANMNGETGSTLTGGSDFGDANLFTPYTFKSQSLTDMIKGKINTSVTHVTPLIDKIFNETQQNFIANTTNITYFTSDITNNLRKTNAEAAVTSTPYYSKTTDKLYALGFRYAVDNAAKDNGTTNSILDFGGSSGAIEMRNFTTDYALAHFVYNYVRTDAQTNAPFSTVWLRSGYPSYSYSSCFVSPYGYVSGGHVSNANVGVRPSFIFTNS